MAVVTVVKTIGTTGTFSTPQLWEDGAPADLTTAEKSAAGTFAVATFQQGENITFVGSGATGKLVDTDSTGVGTETYVTYGITAGNPAASDVITGVTSLATCILTSGTADNVGVVWQGKCQNQEFASSVDILWINGSTDSATAYKEITTVAGASFRDNANVQTNALRYNAANGCGFSSTHASFAVVLIAESFARISNLQIATTGTNAYALNSASASFCDNCILEGTRNTGPDDGGAGLFQSSMIVRNCVLVLRVSGGLSIVSTYNASAAVFYNCTFVAPDDLATAPTSIFLSSSAGNVTAQNCALYAGDSTKAIKSGTGTYNFTTCYSDISGTSGVTQATYSSQFENVNDATRDFRAKAGADILNTGTTDATNASTDIAGTARPQGAAYDVGAWELVVIPPVAPTLFVVQSGLRW